MSTQYSQTHTVVQFWANRPAPTRATPLGECLAWHVIDGKAVQCGAKCEGQRCADHPQGVRVHFNIGGKGGAAQ